MRISRLDIRAYGPFTNQILDFDTGQPGLHVIYGPNEAGKSSSLRALKVWLFGFPDQTDDDFRHAYKDLLVGGSIATSDNRQLTFFRRKRKKADIVDENGEPLSLEILAPFVPIQDRLVFDSLYGIDHNSLIRGGEDILAQKGEMGQTLFSAGAGISSLRQITLRLNADAELLFKKQGKKQKISESITRFRAIKKRIKDAELSGREWKTLAADLKKAEQEQKETDIQLADKERERRRLERIKQALPQLIQRKELNDKIAALGEVVDIPTDFIEKRQSSEEQLQILTREQTDIQRKLKAFDEQLENLNVDQALLDQAATIKKLPKLLGADEKAMQDRPRLEGMRSTCLSDARLSLKQVVPDVDISNIEELRTVFGKRKLIEILAKQHEEIQMAIRQIEKRERTLNSDLQTAREKLEQLPKPQKTAGLKNAIKQSHKLGSIDATIVDKQQVVANQQLNCQQELAKLGLWSGELAELLSLPFPMPETVSAYEKQFSMLESEKKEADKQCTDLSLKLQETEKNIQNLHESGELPTEEELAEARSRREQGWLLLRRQWLDGDNVTDEATIYSDDLDLPDAYEESVDFADATVDHLRREAGHVQQYAAFKKEENSLKRQLSDSERQFQNLESRLASLSNEWQKSWRPTGIDPLSPREMEAWLNRVEHLQINIKNTMQLKREHDNLLQQRLSMKGDILAELTAIGVKKKETGETLSALVDRVEQFLEQNEKSENQRRELEDKQLTYKGELEQLGNEREQARSTLTHWQKKWNDIVSPLSVGREIHPDETADLLHHLRDCFSKLKEADDFQKRIKGIDSDRAVFSTTVSGLVKAIAPELEKASLQKAVTQLEADLKKSTDNLVSLQENTKERQELDTRFQKNRERINEFENSLAEQCRFAGVEGVEELPAVEERSKTHNSFKAALIDLEQALIEGAEGLTIEELEKQAKETDSDELASRITLLEREIKEDLNPRIRQISELIGQKRTEIGRMDGNADAADALEEGTQELAGMVRLVNQYVRLKLATRVLNIEIERFRAENQDPVLKIASRYFRQLTLESFSGLHTDEDHHGKPILVGLRKDKSRLHVEQMSTGTRDQLYLALRFASLEWKHQSGEPMPFILDDILVNFDDHRSQAALRAMADLSTNTQVILFTHHRQVVEAAEQLTNTPDMKIHKL